MLIAWGVSTLFFIVVELITYGITSIWFALGSLAALLVTLIGAPVWLQIAVFVVVSVATLFLTRPLVKKYVNGRTQPTNFDRLIGMKALVGEEISNLAGTGTVSVDGKVWSAKSEDGTVIPEKTLIEITAISGAHLTVKPSDN